MFRVGRRSAACRSWDGPTSFLSHQQARVITGAETAAAADGGIARCCLRLLSGGGLLARRYLGLPGGAWVGTFVMPGGREWGDGSRLVG